jgi:MOSC domain-containing protein YiiM
MSDPKHLTTAELEAGLPLIKLSPKNDGAVELIVRRPIREKREILTQAELHPDHGVVGDNWRTRSEHPRPENQLTIMNARAVALFAQEKERWPLAGDQLFIDLDLSLQNLPAGTRIEIGTAIVEVSDEPHTGCKKFVARFGQDAMNFANSSLGRQLNLRGINARVVQSGVVRVGDRARKLLGFRFSGG